MADATEPAADERAAAASRALADALRRIIAQLAVVRPRTEQLEAAAEAANSFADQLDPLPKRSKSWEVSEAGLRPRDFLGYSPMSGHSNPIAPPLQMRIVDRGDGDVVTEGDITFGPAYEGPPGHCHGGYVAAMFDELLGFAQLGPGFTAYLKVDYRKPTPLNRQLELRAWIDHVDGRKRLVRGTSSLDGELLAEAEGLFIAPRSGEDYLARLGFTP